MVSANTTVSFLTRDGVVKDERQIHGCAAKRCRDTHVCSCNTWRNDCEDLKRMCCYDTRGSYYLNAISGRRGFVHVSKNVTAC